MRDVIKIKKWQLVRAKQSATELDLTGKEFLTVGKRAFRGGTMESVILPQGVSAIKAEAFIGCKQFKRVILPDENSIGLSYAVFRGCECLQAVENADRISSIGEKAFAGCSALETITLGKNLRRIGEDAFRGCEVLHGIDLSASVAMFGKGAFRDCKALKTVKINDRTKTLAIDLFRGCDSLQEIELPPMISALPNGVFRDCTSLLAIQLPASVRTIGKRAFAGCTQLKSLTMELGVEKIGAHAFADALHLREVFVPHTLKKLGFGAFGLGKRADGEKISILVNNEYMEKRMKRLLSRCGSSGCAEVVVVGKSIEERKRERRRTSLDAAPTHLIDTTLDNKLDKK